MTAAGFETAGGIASPDGPLPPLGVAELGITILPLGGRGDEFVGTEALGTPEAGAAVDDAMPCGSDGP